jgi:hypothetical protein
MLKKIRNRPFLIVLAVLLVGGALALIFGLSSVSPGALVRRTRVPPAAPILDTPIATRVSPSDPGSLAGNEPTPVPPTATPEVSGEADQPAPTPIPQDTSVPSSIALIQPILDCVSPNGNGSYTAHFSYQNSSDATASIPVSSINQVSPEPADRGQPTSFPPGSSDSWPNAPVSVVFDAGQSASWQLANHTATASVDSPLCAYRVQIQIQWYDGQGNQVEGAPADLPPDFVVTAQSEWSDATCSYSGESSDLTCAYTNRGPAPGTDGLWVPAGTMYTVTQSALPSGWMSFTGVGLFPGAGGSRSFNHVIDNRAAGG